MTWKIRYIKKCELIGFSIIKFSGNLTDHRCYSRHWNFFMYAKTLNQHAVQSSIFHPNIVSMVESPNIFNYYVSFSVIGMNIFSMNKYNILFYINLK